MNTTMTFTVEEINFICVMYADTKEDTISKIFKVLPELEDRAMLYLAADVINKLAELTDEEFKEYHFNEIYSE